MEWLLILILALFIWGFSRSKKKNDVSPTEIPVKITVETNFNGSGFGASKTINTGEIKKVGDNTYCINPKSPLPLTLTNTSKADAGQIKKLLNGEAQWKRTIGDITYLIAQKNIECVELEGFAQNLRENVASSLEKLKKDSSEWNGASEKDKEDLIKEFQREAIDSLTTKPANDSSLETLLFESPSNVTADDELLEIFSGDKDLYRFYVSYIGRSSKTYQVSADDYYRKSWEKVTDLGLARRGKDIPVESILEGLRMKDINDYFADRLEKKLTRKAAAVDFAASQPDVMEILSKHISFRELFQLVDPEGVDISDVQACFQYASAQADLIRDTYVTGYQTLETIADAKDADYDGWEIDAEDCCSDCSKFIGKKTKRRPSKLPPFHIGCTCRLEGTYDY